MIITISNFRCFRTPIELTFEDGKLYLLKGQSGAGKTTIFESIRWCLFGNMRNIYPIGFTPAYGGSLKGANKTYVSIKYKNIVILRSQAPEQLRVNIEDENETELSQESAQQYIDGIFGNKNVWLASSFIRQNERCPLMVASNTERMALLNEILFGNESGSPFENPDFYVEKLDEELSKTDKEITAKTAVFNSHYTKYVESIKNFTNPYNWSAMSEEYIGKIEASIEQFKEVITTLSSQLIEVSKLEARKKLLFEKLNGFAVGDASTFRDEVSGDAKDEVSKSAKLKNKIDELYNRKNVIGNDILTLKANLSKSVALQAKFSTLMEELTNAKKELTLYKKPLDSPLNLAEKIKELKSRFQKTQSDENLLIQLNRQLESIKEELNACSTQRSQYDNIVKNRTIEMIQNIIRNTSIYTKLQEIHSMITGLNIDTTSLIPVESIPTEKERLNRELNSIQFIEKLLKKYNIDRSFSLSEKKTAYSEALKNYEVQKEHLIKKSQADAIRKNIDSLNKQRMEVLISLNEAEIDEQIKSIERRIGAPLKCPHCECILEYKNNTLVKPESELITKEEGLMKINELKQAKNALLFNKSIDLKLETYRAQLEMILYDESICSQTVLSPETIGAMKNFLNEFQNFETIPKEDSQSIETKLNTLSKMEQYYKLASEYKTMSASYDTVLGIENNIDELTQAVNNIPMIDGRITRLKNTNDDVEIKIRGINIAVSSNIIQTEIEEMSGLYNEAVAYDLIETKIKRINSELATIDLSECNTFELQNKIEAIEKETKDIDENILLTKTMYSRALEYEECKKQYDEIKIESSEEMVANALETNQHTYNDLLQQHSQAKYMLMLMESRKELEVLQEEMMAMTTKQLNLNKLKSVITEVTNSALQDLVDNINTITNNILEELFDCGIAIELKLYKEVKNKSKVKPYVNICVVKDGEDFDIGVLSGGEKDRVSLALTVALSSLHISPLIFIDEGLSALDEDRKHDCLEITRKYLIPSKNVLNIEHAGVSGFYDDVITVGCC